MSKGKIIIVQWVLLTFVLLIMTAILTQTGGSRKELKRVLDENEQIRDSLREEKESHRAKLDSLNREFIDIELAIQGHIADIEQENDSLLEVTKKRKHVIYKYRNRKIPSKDSRAYLDSLRALARELSRVNPLRVP